MSRDLQANSCTMLDVVMVRPLNLGGGEHVCGLNILFEK